MPDLSTVANQVTSKDDFIEFVRLLEEDRRTNPSSWEAQSIESYLEALGAWVDDMDGAFSNQNKVTPPPSWYLFAQILIAAKYYE